MKRILRQLEQAVDGLEQEIFRLDPDGEDWPFLFRMLRSFRQFRLESYRETLLFEAVPSCLLEMPYRVEDYVDPPRAHCFTKADYFRYSEPEWLELSGTALTDRLPRNEFGYLHPGDCQSFLGITQQTYDRLSALYCRCPVQCREAVDRTLLAMIDLLEPE